MSAKEQFRKEIIEAIVFLRENNHTIPSETIEFMKNASLEALKDKTSPYILIDTGDFNQPIKGVKTEINKGGGNVITGIK